ncbi:MAG: glycosyltransferase family 4 protein [bacterium]
MKIAMLQTPMFPLNLTHCAGVERVELSELEGLNKLGHETKLFVPKLIGADQNITEIKDLGWQNRVLKFYYYLCFWFKARCFDVFHGHYTPIMALLFPRKSVIHFHGGAVLMLPKYDIFKKRYHRAHYVFNSNSTMKAFINVYSAVPRAHLHLLYNAVDLNMFQPQKSHPKREITKICFCGRWTEEKGVFVLLDAIRTLEQKRKDFKLFLIGSAHIPFKTEKSKQIERRIKQRVEALSTVETTGPVEHKKLPDIYKQMDIGVVPSVWAEPFGLVTLEMMAAGLPVIASSVGAIPEIIENNISGILISPDDPAALAYKIEEMIECLDLREQIAKTGRKRVENVFSCDKHIKKLLEIYELVLRKEE